jgi:hypothetical protein
MEGREGEMKTEKDPCRKVIEKMYLVLEEEVRSGSLCDSLQRHMAQCESCASQYKTLEDLVSLCQEFPTEEIPEDQKRKMKEDLLKLL